MATNYSTIQQHQPLRTPAGWDKQEKALIVQLDEIFDDIYRRFGRLRVEDMGKTFRKRFEDAEGAIAEFEFDIDGMNARIADAEGDVATLSVSVTGLETRVTTAEGDIATLSLDVGGLKTRISNAEGDIGELEVKAGEIELAVGNKYEKVAGIVIDSNGIGMTGKNITLNAGSSVDIKTGGTFSVQSGQFSIDENGNASFGGALSAATGTFAGTLNAATGTFAGTLSASCITSGTMSADRIRGGTIDANNVTINNLNASKITSGTIDATNITITNLNASNIKSGSMSANRISGGTLILGGNNNASGTLIIKDANGAQIGKWDNDGISATKGTFSGNLNAAGGTFAGTMSAACITTGTMSADRISGGTIDANNVTINNLNASKITSGTIDASNVTITNLNASNITSGSIDASNVTINNLDASKIKTGTMSADLISGGTLTLGGSNNANGKILIYNASGTQIGKWDNNGLTATKGSFSGNLDAAGGTFSGDLNAAGGTFSGSLVCTGQQVLVSTDNIDIDGDGILKTRSTYRGIKFDAQLGGISTSVVPDNAHTKATIQQSTNTYNGVEYPDVIFTFVNRNTSTRYRHDTGLKLGTTNRYMYDGTYSVGPYMLLTGNTYDQVSQTNSTSLLLDCTLVDAIITKLRVTDAKIQNLNYTNMTQQSSREIKHDIRDMPSMGERLDALHPITFVYDNDEEERKRYGLIYEDTVEVLPEICTGSEENKAISYVELIPMLLKEIQDLRTRIRIIEGRNSDVQSD